MAFLEKYTLTITSTSTGADVNYTRPMVGYLHAISYRPTATTPWVATADVKVSSTDLSVVMLTSAVQLTTGGWTYYPRAPKATSAGATTAISESMAIASQRLRIMTNGSTLASMTGTFDFFVEGTVITS